MNTVVKVKSKQKEEEQEEEGRLGRKNKLSFTKITSVTSKVCLFFFPLSFAR